MHYTDIFAVLIPDDSYNMARKAFALDHNARYLERATATCVTDEPPLWRRDSTPAPQSPDFAGSANASAGAEADPFTSVDRIVLRFSEMNDLVDPRHGIRFGTDERASDLLLGPHGTCGVSAFQFSISTDDNLRVYLHDYNSSYGSSVSYNGEARDQVRRHETWILAYEPGRERRWSEVVVHTAGKLAFRVEILNHHEASPAEYVANLKAFWERCRGTPPSIGRLKLGRHRGGSTSSSMASTVAPSTARTPGDRPIYLYDGILGKGQFGEVRKVIRARDGETYALKMCFPPDRPRAIARSKRKRDDPVWTRWLERVRNEYEIMRTNPHVSQANSAREPFYFPSSTADTSLLPTQPNVVPVLDYQDLPDGPIIVMPYYEKGSLEEFSYVSENQCVKVLLDLLSGLRHLHGRGVVHRDVKLANLLVDDAFNIVIADFGLSKQSSLLTTFCGTPMFVAPEVFPGVAPFYGAKADVWSAGVVVMQLYLGHLPVCPNTELYRQRGEWRKWNDLWCRRLLRQLHDEDENQDRVVKILLAMLEPDPAKRLTANDCLELGLRNGLFRRTPDSYAVNIATPRAVVDDGVKTPTQLLHNGESGAQTPHQIPVAQNQFDSSQLSLSEASTLTCSLIEPRDNNTPTAVLPQSSPSLLSGGERGGSNSFLMENLWALTVASVRETRGLSNRTRGSRGLPTLTTMVAHRAGR